MSDEPEDSEPPALTTNTMVEELLRAYGWARRQIFAVFGIDWSRAHMAIDDRTAWTWAETSDGCIQYAEKEEEFNSEGDYFVDTIKERYWPSVANSQSHHVIFHVDIEDGEGTEELAVFDLRKKREPFS